MRSRPWMPGAVLAVGWVLLLQVGGQQSAPLRAPLASLPRDIAGRPARDQALSPEELRATGVSSSLMRVFGPGEQIQFTLYVGYYESQAQGQTIHSPRNCLPGAGWEPISSGTHRVTTGGGTYTLNRYVIGKDGFQALVLYWYQGRGRISSDEYRVKWELLRDKAIRRRSEEALVRIVVPILGTEERATALADSVARAVIDPLFDLLPLPPQAGAAGQD